MDKAIEDLQLKLELMEIYIKALEDAADDLEKKLNATTERFLGED